MRKLINLLAAFPVFCLGQTPPSLKIELYCLPPEEVRICAEYFPTHTNDYTINFKAVTKECIKISFNTDNNTNFIYRLLYKDVAQNGPRYYYFLLGGVTNQITSNTNFSSWKISPIYVVGNGQTNHFFDLIQTNGQRIYAITVRQDLRNDF